MNIKVVSALGGGFCSAAQPAARRSTNGRSCRPRQSMPVYESCPKLLPSARCFRGGRKENPDEIVEIIQEQLMLFANVIIAKNLRGLKVTKCVHQLNGSRKKQTDNTGGVNSTNGNKATGCILYQTCVLCQTEAS